MSSSPLLLFALLFISASQGYRVEVEPDAQPHLIPQHFFMAGKPDAGREMSLYIGLTPSNSKELTQTLQIVADPSSPSYGKWWTKQEVDKFVAPTAENEQKVLSWLTSENVLSEKERVKFELGEGLNKLVRRSVLFWELRCTVAEAERLLAVNFFSFRNTEKDEGVIVRTTQKYTVPFEVSSAITIIGNVFRFPSNLAVHASVKKARSPESLFITPDVLLARYNVTIPPTNARNIQSVASFLGQYYSDSDLALFSEDYFNGIDCSITRAVGDNDQSQPGIEAALDTQYIQFGNCSITTWDYYTPGQSDLGNEPFLKWLIEVDAECASSVCPYVYSMSYGDYENTITDAYAASVDFEFQMISLTGRTFLAASGDDGVGCTDLYGGDYFNCSYFNSIFISTSPHVVSVGATTSSSLERAAGFSGGGFSDKFSRPSYQGQAVENYFNQDEGVPPTSFYNKFGRGFPDVGVTGVDFLVYWKGVQIPVDGTSASTPTMAQMISMMNSERLNANLPTLGFANPFLYSAWASNTAAFVDVTDGATQAHGCCPAGFAPVAGWEPYCGLGAPDYAVLADMALSPSFIPAFRK